MELPPTVPLGQDFMDPQGAYLLHGGRTLLLWLGRAIQPSFMTQVALTPLQTVRRQISEQAVSLTSIHGSVLHLRGCFRPHGMNGMWLAYAPLACELLPEAPRQAGPALLCKVQNAR